ncbi:hypothetical protein CF319_g1275 [Tilletia indica]|uniref:Major facilitator superfamily (MFS) profile domain-containing protein n=2 Tax=Tilletia TaxID=13289 RepID=A0A8X7N6W9_9BASI|nr:hypothetical protein CF327_g5364 [Tilletia walkeri]KAE8226086.1 hypothetical protein CF319_g1275 [Tilletia indica]KAE8233321.1 hypothetical protein CF326_g1644 [Tilletia indica]KAE8257487.1 hypothetical protein A4X13_0g2321 [Tilletia indica]KAE8268321.1 hypothetical protein A4X09_0g4023 [Tilletia walkeri]
MATTTTQHGATAPAVNAVDKYDRPASPAFTEDHSQKDTPETQSIASNPKQPGVVAAAAAWNLAPWMLAVAWIGIGMTAYAYGLENNMTYATLSQATSIFNNSEWYPTLNVIQQVIIAVAKFPIAKLADVFGRAQGYVLSICFYIVGFILLASAQDIKTTAAGVVFYAIGNSGTQIMQQIVLADWTPARWRGAAIGLVSMPYIINFAVAPRIVASLVNYTDPTDNGWRWLAGMFTIIFPIASFPIIFTLALNQTRGRKRGLVPRHPYFEMSPRRAIWDFIVDIDLIGLLLLCAGLLLILIPLKLQASKPEGWGDGSIIAMLTIGAICLLALAPFEYFLSPKPIIKKRFILNKDVVFPALIGFFDFVSFYLSWTTAYAWVFIVHDWSLADAGYFSNTQSLCLTVFGIAAGFVSVWTRRFKWQMVVGACIRTLGIGLMIHFRSLAATNLQLVWPQVLQGLGGGILGVILQVSAQISVPHQDVATVTAFVLLAAEVGGAVGSAIVGALQVEYLPSRFDFYLPNVDATVRTGLLSSAFVSTPLYPLGSEIRTGFSLAYTDFVHRLLIIGIAVSAIPIILSLLITDRKLSDSQNCVNEKEKAVAVEAVQLAKGHHLEKNDVEQH